jgi:non-specific protein-tyrosine kinase
MEKLRKALEMAKLERQDEPEAMAGPGAIEPEQAVAEPVVARRQEAAAATEDAMAGLAPVYRQSRAEKLDQQELAGNRCLSIFSEPFEIEAYKMLRTHVMQRTDPNGWNTIMVTSALPGEGKTVTAVNLALTFAKEYNHTVLLVDCDLRKQAVHKALGIDGQLGLVDALLDNIPLQELMVWPGVEKLTLISGERTVSDASEMLTSLKMKALVNEIKTRYPDRYVIFDLPPLLTTADAVAFSPFVDAILMVVQSGKTSIADVKKAVDLLPREKFIGFVLNKHKAPSQAPY